MRLVWLLVLCFACLPTAPDGAEPFTPPAFFADLWRRMEVCSGRRGDWHRVEWFVVPNGSLSDPNELTLAQWHHPHRVYLVAEVVHHTDGRPPWQPWAQVVVMHEMLHDLTGPAHGRVFDYCGVRSP